MNLQITPEIESTEETKTELEPLYRVIIHNDDVTPMDFVVNVLTSIFCLSQSGAMDTMLVAHFNGAAYVQTLPKAEAEKRINKAHFAAGLEGFPLHFSIEPE
ncbi:MAG: ATP-dependent Clp protease adaptor ClpS [Chloroflexi bacterium]|jgi:ATP-dependent Clp protease adaptor protein ClpS|nr:ATP-dependent Clp protease adaptor ClpS [Chloroflexota bacterium]